MISEIKNSLVKGKKSLWNFEFSQKVAGHKATLGGLGDKAVTLKLQSNKSYPHLDIKAFLNWETYDEWTKEEKALVQALRQELDDALFLKEAYDKCNGDCGGCSAMYDCHGLD